MRVAIVGGGQLARMMAMAGMEIGVTCSFLVEPEENTSCVEGLGILVQRSADWGAEQVLSALGSPDVVTIEREAVDLELLRQLQRHGPVHPNPNAVAPLQHRLMEKNLVASLGLATAPFAGATNAEQLELAVKRLGYPVMIKSCRDGYDGRGQAHIVDRDQLKKFGDEQGNGDWLVESRIAFDREVSLIGVRSTTGEMAFYPLTENAHREGILHSSIAPAAHVSAALEGRARDYLKAVITELDYVGVIAMECFLVGDELLVNEFAPRVHNSGHWTMLSEASSQFENHLRAVLGMPLGDTQISHCAGMVNILGSYSRSETLQHLPPGAALVDYNKSAAPRRKLGHVNLMGSDRQALTRDLSAVTRHLFPGA